jgi:hypothetical protein
VGDYSKGKNILPPDMEERLQKERQEESRREAEREHQANSVHRSRWHRLLGWWPGSRHSDVDRTNARRALTVGSTVAMLAVGVTALILGFRDRSPSRPPKTWVVADGETRSFFTTQVVESDIFRCADGPGAVKPPRGSGVWNSAGISVETGWNGVVTVTCGHGPPAPS